jgi:hypothetical protein
VYAKSKSAWFDAVEYYAFRIFLLSSLVLALSYVFRYEVSEWSRAVLHGPRYTHSMDSDRQWHLAWAQLEALRKNLPEQVEEKHVSEFHSILNLLHEATSEDISSFRIPEEEVKPIIAGVLRPTRRRPGHTTYSSKKYCDRDLMLRKIDAVFGYFKRLEPPPEKSKYGF